MLIWFFPAFTIVLCIRHGLKTRLAVRQLLGIMLISAAALGVFGIVQFVAGAKAMFWVVPMSDHFFATFGYENNAASFFVLMLGPAIGLMLRVLFRIREGASKRVMLSLYLGASLLMLVCAQLSLSRAGILLSWACALFAAGYCVVKAFKHLSPAERLKIGMAALAVIVLGFMAVSWCARDQASRELATLTSGKTYEKGVLCRVWESEAGLRIWKDYPWFGTGGWGFRHMAKLYVPVDQWYRFNTGTANVHNDAVQFLVEFGVVGFGLLAATVVILLVPLVKARFWRRELALFSVAGLGLVFMHSMIDPAFRCPPVLFSWLAILTGISCYVQLERTSKREEPHSWQNL